MKQIILGIISFLGCISSFAQAKPCDDNAFLRVAKEQFSVELNKRIAHAGRNKRYRVSMSLSDTSNIKFIFPIYDVKTISLDSITENSFFSNMIKLKNNPFNQIFVVVNPENIWTCYYRRGIWDNIALLNKEHPSMAFYDGIGCDVIERFDINDITSFKSLVDFISANVSLELFGVEDFEGLWYYDKSDVLCHVRQEGSRIVVEDGQAFFERLVETVGIDVIRTRMQRVW